jgi:hypothetical protein
MEKKRINNLHLAVYKKQTLGKKNVLRKELKNMGTKCTQYRKT